MTTKELWQLMDKFRSKGERKDIFQILKEAKAHELPVRIEHIHSLLPRLDAHYGELFCPEHIIAFIKMYLAERKIKTILDPWAKIGLIAIPLAEPFGLGMAGLDWAWRDCE